MAHETPRTVANQAALCMEFFRQEYWGRCSHSLLQGIFPSHGSNPGLLHYRWPLYHLTHQGIPLWYILTKYSVLMLYFELLWWLRW